MARKKFGALNGPKYSSLFLRREQLYKRESNLLALDQFNERLLWNALIDEEHNEQHYVLACDFKHLRHQILSIPRPFKKK